MSVRAYHPASTSSTRIVEGSEASWAWASVLAVIAQRVHRVWLDGCSNYDSEMPHEATEARDLIHQLGRVRTSEAFGPTGWGASWCFVEVGPRRVGERLPPQPKESARCWKQSALNAPTH